MMRIDFSDYRSTWALIATGLASLLLAGACASGGGQVPDAGPVPDGADFQGVWYSPQFEHLFLRQNGDEVEGVYSYKSGGRLEGDVDGNILKFKWVDPGSKEKAQRTMSGHGYLRLVREDDKLKLTGEWGYDEDFAGAGPWEAEYVRELEQEDPASIEEIREAYD